MVLGLVVGAEGQVERVMIVGEAEKKIQRDAELVVV
jgi:hypothetical protein